MAAKMIKDSAVDNYVNILKSRGENGLYKFAVGNGIVQSTMTNTDIEMLDAAEKAFSMYRRNGKDEYFVVGKVLRRAAHAVYRQFLRIKSNKPINNRFLNMVKNK